jgi:virulence-associated protein VapD
MKQYKSTTRNLKLGNTANIVSNKAENIIRNKRKRATAIMQSLSKNQIIKIKHNSTYLHKRNITTYTGVVIAISIDKLDRFVKCVVRVKRFDRFENICVSFIDLIDGTYEIVE